MAVSKAALMLWIGGPFMYFCLLGGPDPAKAAKYILWRFTQTNRAKLNIYPQ